MIKNVKLVKLNAKTEINLLNTQTLKIIRQNSNVCVVIRIIKRRFDESLKKLFFNICKFSNHDNNKFILLLQKGIYPYG